MKDFSFGIAPYLIKDNKIFIYVSKSSSVSFYGFIKGKIEFKESILDCVKREVKEEINLDIDTYFLEKYFFQHSKKKDVGIFLINSINIDFSSLFLNQEIYSFELQELSYDLYLSFCPNQQKILNDIFLYFKQHYFIKSLKKETYFTNITK